MGDSRRMCVSSPLVCFFFFLSFFLLIIITFSMGTMTATLPIPSRRGSSGNCSEWMGTGNGGRGLETQMRLESLVCFFFMFFFFLLLIIVLTSSPFVREPPSRSQMRCGVFFFCVSIFYFLFYFGQVPRPKRRSHASSTG
jgi:hypothetical protein